MTATQRTFIIVSVLIAIFALPTKADYRQDSMAIDISGGEDHTLVLTKNKSAWACGPNGGYDYDVHESYYGVLGTGSDDRYLEQKTLVRVHGPNDVNYLGDINDIDSGWKHSLALEKYDPNDPNYMGYVWSWGWNSWGQLGIDNDDPRTAPVRVWRGEQPEDPCQPDGYLKYIIDISAGRSGEFSLAADVNGYAYGWGRNQKGQLGNGESGDYERELMPVYVHRGVQPPEDPCNPDPNLTRIVAVSAGAEHGMALEGRDPCDPNLHGRVYTWGDNYFVVNAGHGVLGHGMDSNSNTPVLVLRGEQDYNEPNHVYLKDIVAISAGWDHSMALEKYEVYDYYLEWSDPCYTGPDPNHKGRVYTWGNNGEGWRGWSEERTEGGRLGDGSTDSNDTPVLVLRGEQPAEDPNEPYPYLSRITAVSAGEGHSMAVDANGNVYCWGDNYYGQLGNDSNVASTTPVRVVSPNDPNLPLENIVAIAAGYWHSIAIDADGTVWTWGKAKEGRLGKANNTDNSSIPHPIGVVYNETQKTFQFAIQNAINEADNNDVLEASESRYWENVNFLDKSITLRSSNPCNWNTVNNTIIDGSYNTEGAEDPCFYAVNFNDGSGSTLAGFTISDANRGGVRCENLSSVDITDCKIQNNICDGIYITQSSANIKNCRIQNNGHSEILDFYGIYCENNSDINVTDCNIANNNDGGIYCNNSDLTVSNCIVQDNGGNGINCNDILQGAEIKNNWIYNNDSNGVYIYNSVAPNVNAIIQNNTIVNNAAYGINSGWAVDANIMNCIIWGNGSDPNYNLYAGDSGTFDVNYSCIEGDPVYPGTENINSDPCFYDDPNDPNNYHLSFGSPCIDTGDPNFEPDPNETDIDGEGRVKDGDANGTVIVDMGADEYYWSPADFNGDKIVNFIDYAMFAPHWLETDDSNGYNDIYDLADNNSIDFNDVALFCDDCLWQPAWTLPPLPMMGRGMGQGLGLAESSYPSTLAEQPAKVEPLTFEQIMQMIIWLEEIWLDPEVRKAIDEDTWLKFVESIKNEM